MLKKDYKFNPEDYGFSHVSNFPELNAFVSSSCYVKVTEISKDSNIPYSVYWYKTCRKVSEFDERFEITAGSFIEENKLNLHENYKQKSVYFGLISSDLFAVELLNNLNGGIKNESVFSFGKKRISQNINNQRLEKN